MRTPKQSSIIKYSREKAHKLMKTLNPEITQKDIIHHKDENPLNNSVDNLEVMTNSKHLKFHNNVCKRWGVSKDPLKRLEKLLTDFNNH